MQERKGFSLETHKRSEWRPFERRFSDNFTDEDIERAWRRACEKVGPFVMPVMPEERKQ